jgi:hypothetical protein
MARKRSSTSEIPASKKGSNDSSSEEEYKEDTSSGSQEEAIHPESLLLQRPQRKKAPTIIPPTIAVLPRDNPPMDHAATRQPSSVAMLPTNNWIDDIQKSMSSETFKFLEHVFSEEQTEVKHQQLPLVDFINIFPSPKLKVFAHSKKDFNTY